MNYTNITTACTSKRTTTVINSLIVGIVIVLKLFQFTEAQLAQGRYGSPTDDRKQHKSISIAQY